MRRLQDLATPVTQLPTITGFTPTSGSPNTFINLFGSGFVVNQTQVSVNYVSAPFVQGIDSGFLIFILPGGNTTGPITVTMPNGSATSTTSFGVTLPGVQVTGLSPAQGKVNDFVFVFGAGFVTGATQVRLNSISAPLVQVLSPNLLLFMVPPGATTGPVSATASQGSATSTTSFTGKGSPERGPPERGRSDLKIGNAMIF